METGKEHSWHLDIRQQRVLLGKWKLDGLGEEQGEDDEWRHLDGAWEEQAGVSALGRPGDHVS